MDLNWTEVTWKMEVNQAGEGVDSRGKRQSLCRSKTRCIVHNNIPVRVPYILPGGNRKDLGRKEAKKALQLI